MDMTLNVRLPKFQTTIIEKFSDVKQQKYIF